MCVRKGWFTQSIAAGNYTEGFLLLKTLSQDDYLRIIVNIKVACPCGGLCSDYWATANVKCSRGK